MTILMLVTTRSGNKKEQENLVHRGRWEDVEHFVLGALFLGFPLGECLGGSQACMDGPSFRGKERLGVSRVRQRDGW